MKATFGAALVLACVLPGLTSAQGRPAGVSIPQVPTVVHPPQLAAAPTLPHAPPSVPAVPAMPAAPAATRLFAIPPSAALHLPGLFQPPSAALEALTHGPAAVALDRGRGQALTAVAQRSTGPDPARLQRHAGLAKTAPDVFELDGRGELVLRGQVLATGADQRALAAAARLGFQVVERQSLSGLGLQLAVLRAPSALTVEEAIARLQAAAPDGVFEPNPIYDAVASAPSAPASPPAGTRRAGKVDIGIIDTGVEAGHAALAGSRIVQQGFTAGGLRPGEHGTAVASLIAGEAGSYRGVAPRSTIYVADVYGAGPGGGSAAAVAQAIDWLVRQKAPVINISLVGPANRVLENAIQAAVAHGAVVVAAVGNDGPFSPPLYPAAYRDVVAVTGVDRRDAILAEAVRSTPVAFAAPGADIVAAHLGGGFEQVRGTSFAAPIVAAEIAMAHHRMDRADALRALAELQNKAVKAPGAGAAAYGWGLVGDDLRPGLAAGRHDALAEK